MLARIGNSTKKSQKHQNTFKFKHNKNSKKTKRIQANSSIILSNLCQRCYQIIQWRIDYRKYKELTCPKKCLKCTNKTINKPYRSICDNCANKLHICSKCGNQCNQFAIPNKSGITKDAKYDLIEKQLDNLRERDRRKKLRGLLNGKIDFDPETKNFLEKETNSHEECSYSSSSESEGEDLDDDEDIMSQDEQKGKNDHKYDIEESKKKEEAEKEINSDHDS